MNQQSLILKVEITMVNRDDLDPNQIFQPLNIYQTTERNYFSFVAIKRIISAIVDLVLHLGSAAHSRSSSSSDDWDAKRPHRHPLYFNVQILPGKEIDICDVFFDTPSASKRCQRARN